MGVNLGRVSQPRTANEWPMSSLHCEDAVKIQCGDDAYRCVNCRSVQLEVDRNMNEAIRSTPDWSTDITSS